MNYTLLLPLLVTAFVAILGWFAAHQLAAARDRTNKRRELRVQYLIDAYRNLEASSNRDQLYELDWSALEAAIADIQLFGTLTQVKKARKFAEDFSNHGAASLDDLLFDLRRDLRRELRLEAVPDSVKYLRITPLALTSNTGSNTIIRTPSVRPIGVEDTNVRAG